MYNIKIFIFLNLINFIQTKQQKFPFDTIVTFGDSHTDTGNVYNLTNDQWPLVPPYYQGRFTNGPLWIDKFNFSFIMNYAYGDATIDNYNLVPGFTGPNQTAVPGIRQQIVTYLTANDVSSIDLSRTLYIIWSGGNEYIINSSLTSIQVVASLTSAVNDLLVAGIKNLIVMNLLPLEFFPGINNKQLFNTLVNQHNYLLLNITQLSFQYTGISIRIFDLYSLIINIINTNNNTLNTIDQCWNMVNYTIISQCNNSNEYMFIDNYHFTTIIHEIIANNIQQFILSSCSRTFSFFIKFYISILLTICIIKK